MNPITFPLEAGRQGRAVGDLQDALLFFLNRGILLREEEERRLELTAILRQERVEELYGDATVRLVAQFQEEQRLEPADRGAVDETTASAMNALLREWGQLDPGDRERPRVVSGRVRREDGLPLGSALVRAFHETEAGAIRLGEDAPDAAGRYTIRYELLPELASVNLRVEVFNEAGERLVASELVAEAKAIETIHLTIPRPATLPFGVRGVVEDAEGNPLDEVVVTLYDRDLGAVRQLLGTDTTRNGGRFEIGYGLDTFAEGEAAGTATADLIFEFSQAEQLLALLRLVQLFAEGDPPVIREESVSPDDLALGIAARPEELVRVTLGTVPAPRTLTEYEQLLAAMQPLLGERTPADLDEQQFRDISFVAREIGQERQRIVFLHAAFTLAQREFDNAIPASVLYGVARLTGAESLVALAALSTAALSRAIEQAVEAQLIPLPPQPIPELAERIHSRAVEDALAFRPAATRGSLGDLVTPTVPDAHLRSQLLSAAVNHSGDVASFWQQVSVDHPTLPVPTLQFALQLGALTRNNLPLIQALQERHPAISSMKTLALHLDESDLTALLEQEQIPIPSGMLGATEAEQRLSYARSIVGAVQAAHPSAVAARVVGALPVTTLAQVQPQVARFLSNAVVGVDEFDLGTSRLDNLIRQHQETLFEGIAAEERAEVVAQTKRVQRLYRISDSPTSLGYLLTTELHASHQIASLDRETFVSEHGPQLGALEAMTIHDNAVGISSRNVLLWSHIHDIMHGVHPRAINLQEADNGARAAVLEIFPNYEELFRGLDLCACDHCRSVYSPAAYYVDLLHMLRNGPKRDGQTPLEVLRDRRPDLEHIILSCENTNTTLPYVDLVNEVLESYIVFQRTLPRRRDADGSIIQPPQDAPNESSAGLSSAELAANPEHLDNQAYELLAQAVYPFSLPFNQPIESARVYLEHLKSSRATLLAIFGDATTTEGKYALVAEQLGLTPDEWSLLTGKLLDGQDAPARPVSDYFGFESPAPPPAVAWEEQLGQVPTFLDRTGIVYTDLVELLTTRFINPATPRGAALAMFQRLPLTMPELKTLVEEEFATITPAMQKRFDEANLKVEEVRAWATTTYQQITKLIVLDAPAGSCDPARTMIRHLDTTILEESEWDTMQRFIRLWRRSGWSLRDLDRACAAVGASVITPDLLVQLAHIKQLQQDLNLPVTVLASFWNDIQSEGKDALYRKLFLNRAALRHDQAFLVADDGTVLGDATQAIRAHIPTLMAGLRLSESDIAAIVEDGALDGALTLPNVSVLHRYGALARALKLKIGDLITLKALTGLDPFLAQRPDLTARFVALAREVKASRFPIAQLNYLYRHVAAANAAWVPQPAALESLLKSLRDGLKKVADEARSGVTLEQRAGATTVVAPTGDLLLAKLTPLVGSERATATVAALSDTPPYTSAAMAAAPPLTLPQTSGPIWYDPVARRLKSQQALTPTQLALLLTLSDDAAYQSAVRELAAGTPSTTLLAQVPSIAFSYSPDDALTIVSQGNQQFLRFNGSMTGDQRDLLLTLSADAPYQSLINELFARSRSVALETMRRSLAPYVPDPAAILDSGGLPERFAALLTLILPLLTRQLQRSHVKSVLAAALKVDPEVAALLLENEAVLRSRSVPTEPVIADLLDESASDEQWVHTLLRLFKAALFILGFRLNRAEILYLAGHGSRFDAFSFDGFAFSQSEPYLQARFVSWKRVAEMIRLRDSLPSREVELVDVLDSFGNPGFDALTFASSDCSGTATVRRDAIIDFDTPRPLPEATSSDTAWSIRWQGAVLPPTDEAHTFTVTSRGGVRLWVNEQLVIDRWTGSAPATDTTGPLLPAAAPFYTIRVEYTPNQAEPQIQLAWSSPTLNQEGIPSSRIWNREPVAALCAATGWNRAELLKLMEPATLAATRERYADERELLRIQPRLALYHLTGISVTALRRWATASSIPATLREVARDIKEVTKARYDDDAWLEVARPLSDRLRQRQRVALVDYLLPRLGYDSPNQLFEHFLIDVEMEPCMLTSRIKQAISSVQLFIQRCQMNLEPAVAPTAINPRHWQWMKNYRVWEANRKVFLYPENWIEPDLRDDKSPFFKELESALLQNDVTNANVEQALLDYLEKLDEVAQLELCGMYRQSVFEPGENHTSILHVFGRTFNPPHQYFYRQLVDEKIWTAWEKVSVDIQGVEVETKRKNQRTLDSGVSLVPFVWNRRLYLFWLLFNEKADPAENTPGSTTDKPSQPRKYLEVKLAWSQYSQGKWMAKQVSSAVLTTANYLERHHFVAKAVVTDGGALRVLVYRANWSPRKQGRLARPFVSEATQRLNEVGEFLLMPSTHQIQAVPTAPVSLYHIATPWQYVAQYSFFVQQDNLAGTALALRFSHDAHDFQDRGAKLFTKDGVLAGETLGTTLANSRVIHSGQFAQFSYHSPFFYQDAQRAFVVFPTLSRSRFFREFERPEFVPFTPLPKELDVKIRPRLSDMLASDSSSTRANPWVQANTKQFALAEQVQMTVQVPVGVRPLIVAEPDGQAAPIMAMAFHGAAPIVAFDADAARLKAEAFSERFGWGAASVSLRFAPFYHPFVGAFIQGLRARGIPGLLNLENQRLRREPFKQQYQPTAQVVAPYPREEVDFARYDGEQADGACAIYNWELFFHAPLLIATCLMDNQQFEAALRWFHFIFDPTDRSDSAPGESVTAHFWKVLPFRTTEKERIGELLERLNKGEAGPVAQWSELKDNPFQPHRVARMRLIAYQKNVFMKYLDCLLGWGDHLFRQDTIESINQATQLYVLAGNLLGERPSRIPPRGQPSPKSYAQLQTLDAFSNALDSFEQALPYASREPLGSDSGATHALLGIGRSFYFCIPHNEKLVGYWDTVADRLFKIRHCMTIEGVVRQLPLFEPPIDPALLVQAAAKGVDLSSVLSDMHAPLPHYRFTFMLRKAIEFCEDLRALGGALLSALEKRDAEALGLVRAGHERAMLALIREVKKQQLADAENAQAAMLKSKAITEKRRDHYRDIAKVSAQEAEHMHNLRVAHTWSTIAQATNLLASLTFLTPDFHIGTAGVWGSPYLHVDFGGKNLGPSVKAVAEGMNMIAGSHAHDAKMAEIIGGQERRWDEWKFQEALANKELDQIDQQLVSTAIRIAIANQELLNHEKQIAHAEEVETYLKTKFTSDELYTWMQGELAALFFQSYRLAYDLAKQAERCFRFERGVTSSNYIQFGYWDSLRKGLMSGERLHLALKQLERAYLEQNRREHEITKHISLLQLNPLALMALKQSGRCEFQVPEALFDTDFPGHYFRRMKSVSLTVPCVVGPYTSVNGTLTLLSNRIRVSSLVADGYAEQIEQDDPRFLTDFAPMQAIVTSHAQNDSGMFELTLRDERYLPFEGAGVVARWRIELPTDFRQFDYDTISDVVLHLRYTAREGGAALREAAVGNLKAWLADEEGKPQSRLFSLRHEFPAEWQRLQQVADSRGDHLQPFSLSKQRFPFMFRGATLTVRGVELFGVPKKQARNTPASTLSLTLTGPDPAEPPLQLRQAATVGGLVHMIASANVEVKEVGNSRKEADWTIHVAQVAVPASLESLEDILLLCHYSVEMAKRP